MSQKIALLTGGSSDIAMAIAGALIDNNYKVILTSRDDSKYVVLKDQLGELGNNLEFIKADLTKEDDINKISSSIQSLDLLVNIAAIWHSANEVFAGKNYEDFDWSVVRNTMEVGIIAPLKLAYGLINKMTKDSNIINLSGTFENGGKGWLPYYVSKKALEDFTYGLADELEEKQIRVNGISPSDTNTQPYAKFFPEYAIDAIQPKKIAELVLEIINSKRNKTVQVIKNYNYSEDDKLYLKRTIQLSEESFEKGHFPAGSLVVKRSEIISEEVSAKYPNFHLHADCKAVDVAIQKVGDQLSDCTLYCSMEPCLMCLSRAYWTGIRRIVFAIKKEKSNPEYYESIHSTNELLEKFNAGIEFVHIEELEGEAMEVVRKWESD